MNKMYKLNLYPQRSLRALLWMVIISTLCQTAYAKEQSVGSLVKVVNESHMTNRLGIERKAERRAEIYPGDVIRTGKKGWVTINFFDLTRVVLRPDTEFIVRKFPQTMTSGNIELEFVQGGARVTSGTIAARAKGRFKIMTPQGELKGDRSEWVMRSCSGDDCTQVQNSFSKCSRYVNLPTQNREFIATYRGNVDVNYCPARADIAEGTTLIFDQEQQTCHVIDEVPCFILYDGKLGRDKLRKFLPKLTPTENTEERPDRPDSRNSSPRRR